MQAEYLNVGGLVAISQSKQDALEFGACCICSEWRGVEEDSDVDQDKGDDNDELLRLNCW